MSIRKVHRPWLYIFYTIAIWACYFLHFYLTFYSFDFSAHLGWMAGLVLFVVGSIAVIVPTPNGAGPWHFAVITMMMMYGVWRKQGRCRNICAFGARDSNLFINFVGYIWIGGFAAYKQT